MMATALLAMSCDDFLTEDPKGLITPSNYMTNQEALDGSVTALYQKVNLTQSGTNMMYPQWQGDDITANPGSNKQACPNWMPSVPPTTTRDLRRRGTTTMPS